MATDVQTRFHEEWLGLAQPYEGLVFSVPVLADAQITPQVGADLTGRFRQHLQQGAEDEAGTIGNLKAFFENFLGYTHSGALIERESVPDELQFYAQEGQQLLKPSFVIARTAAAADDQDDLFAGIGDATPPAAKAGDDESSHFALVWDVRDDAGEEALGLDLDKPEQATGAWRYPPTAKFERLLRATGVPLGFLSNGRDIRLVYAPPGESTSHLTFRSEVMQRPDGRPVLAAFELLLSANRTYGASPEFTVEGLLKESRSRQADVTKELASQVFEAVELLLTGLEAAGNRDAATGRPDSLRAALSEPHDHAYQGILSVVLRLVFLLYAEDQSLLPVQNSTFAKHMSVKGLYDELVEDVGQHPESMNHRFGAYGRLLSLFRAVFFGVEHGELRLPPRRGRLFDPNTFPFLEGGLPGTTSAYLVPEERAATRPPSVDDGTIYEVLHRLIFFQGQRLSYASLDVEQLGSVYESLMGFHVFRLAEPAVRMGKNGVWVEAGELKKAKAVDRKKLLKEDVGLSAAQMKKVDEALKEHSDLHRQVDALNELSPGGKKERQKHLGRPGQLVLQPGDERRRSGSHYTPRSLTEGIVRRTLEPLFNCLGEEPTEEQILSLKICDPAMGSGAFLVEVVRQMALKLEEIWTREGRLAALSEKHTDARLYARRLVAQRCVYGVDKNAAAVELAKLSLWLITLSADLPFTFVDHALRHGDSLVGLSLEQVSRFHWAEEKQVPLFEKTLKAALQESLEHRAELLELATDDSPRSLEERRRLLDHAEHATNRVRVVADLCVGAFFAEAKDKARNAERERRMHLATLWLNGESSVESEVLGLAADVRDQLAPFHWMLEFPEVFYLQRPDPLDGGKADGAAMMEAFVGNPPFLGGPNISLSLGANFVDWLKLAFPGDRGERGQCDLVAFFLRRATELLGTHGVWGFVSTKALAEGDTRSIGLKHLLANGLRIYWAVPRALWPGEADVQVSVVAAGLGIVAARQAPRLGEVPVSTINSRLRAAVETDDPVRLLQNRGVAGCGVKHYGDGFVLEKDVAMMLIAEAEENSAVIRPFLRGIELNSSPDLEHLKYIIDFGSRSLEASRRFKGPMRIVESLVRPVREALPAKNSVNKDRRARWWQFAGKSPEIYAAIEGLEKCLVLARDPKHLALGFVHPNQVFSEKVVVVASSEVSTFSTLQSRLHVAWSQRFGRATGGAGTFSYSSRRCFETFPFPFGDPRTAVHSLAEVGARVLDARASLMTTKQIGLTELYSMLYDSTCEEQEVLCLRSMHEELDRAVLCAYPKLPGIGSDDPSTVGWSDVQVPPFCVATDEERAALQAFEDEVIDRLLVLNEIRANEEKKAKPEKAAKKSSKKSKKKTASTKEPSGQGSLF